MEIVIRGTHEELETFLKSGAIPKIPQEAIVIKHTPGPAGKGVSSIEDWNEAEKILNDEWWYLVPFVVKWMEDRGEDITPSVEWVSDQLRQMASKKRHVLLSRAMAARLPNRNMANASIWGIGSIATRLNIKRNSVTSTRVDTINELVKLWKKGARDATGIFD